MNEDDVATYLRLNPQFFDQHPELLEKIHVPHPYGGRAIPLAERQTVALREKAKLLEGKLGELIQFGEENDVISEKVHRLAVAIAGARDFPALAQSLYFHLREDFAVPHVAMRVWGKSVPVDFEEAAAVGEAERRQAATMAVPHVALRVWGKSVPADFEEAAAVGEAERREAATMATPQCGPAAGSGFAAWFGEAAEHVRSLALVPLGHTAVFGLLLLGSEDPQRFYPEMGTLYLRRIGELCAAGVTARL